MTTNNHQHSWKADQARVGVSCTNCEISQVDWYFDEHRRLVSLIRDLQPWSANLPLHLQDRLLKALPAWI